jgi:AP-3 complex subunit mu
MTSLQRWASDKTLSFVPPDGKFVLMEYRYSPASGTAGLNRDMVPVPFTMKSNIEISDHTGWFMRR